MAKEPQNRKACKLQEISNFNNHPFLGFLVFILQKNNAAISR